MNSSSFINEREREREREREIERERERERETERERERERDRERERERERESDRERESNGKYISGIQNGKQKKTDFIKFWNGKGESLKRKISASTHHTLSIHSTPQLCFAFILKKRQIIFILNK